MVEPQAFQNCAHAMRMTLKILRMFLARPAGGRYVTAFQHPSPRWLSALSRFAKSQALHLGDHSLGAGSSSAAFSSTYSCRGRHHCMLRVPGNSIFLPQDSADLSADQSVADGATCRSQPMCRSSSQLPKSSDPAETGRATAPQNPKSIITAKTK